MNKTLRTKSSNINIISFVMVFGVLVFLTMGCQQINDAVNSNTATNTNTTANTNATANANTNANTNASSDVTANSNANANISDSNKSADNALKTAKPELEMPSNEKMQAMVKEVMLDFNDAVQKGDFTDFRNKCSKPFQKDASVEKFNSAFGVFFPQKVAFQKVTDSLEDMNAEFSTGPNINKVSGINYLEVTGKYQSVPTPLNFEMEFIPEEKEWKLIKVRVVAGK